MSGEVTAPNKTHVRRPAHFAEGTDFVRCVALFYKFGAAPRDFILKEKFRMQLPKNIYQVQCIQCI